MDIDELSEEDEERVRIWMEDNYEDYFDECDELDCTHLAEDCAVALNLCVGDDEHIPEAIFEIAVEFE